MRRSFNPTVVRFLIVWVALSVASFSWAIATPLGATPDEPAHIVKAASVAQGQLIGEPTDAPAVTLVQVPAGLAASSAWTCYAFNPSVSAACIDEPVDGLELTDAATSAGLYNPTYYALVGWPSTFIADSTTAVLTMRAVSAAIVSFLLAFVFVGLFAIARPLVAGVAFFAAVTPMVLFLAGAINPNGLEIAAGAALLVGLLWAARGSKDVPGESPAPSWGVLAVTALAGILLANSRGISPLWMALIAAMVFVIVPWSRMKELLARWDVRATIVLLGLGVAGAGLWLLTTGTLGAMGTFPGAGEVSPMKAFIVMLVTRTADPGLIGVFGWLDTFAPGTAYVIWSMLLCGIAVIALVLARGRELAGAAFATAVFLLAPPIVQALSVQNSGYIWQGRYSLVLLVCLVIVAAVAISRHTGDAPESSPIPVRGVIVVSLLVLIGQVHTFVSTIGRYAGGGPTPEFSALASPEWTPPGGTILWTIVFAVSLIVPMLVWRSATRTVRIPA